MKLIDLDQGSSQWLEFRKKKLGASDAPTIMGVSPWTTSFQLWSEKLGISERPKSNSAMQRGHELESKARMVVEESLGMEFIPRVFQHRSIDYMIASLDGISSDLKTAVEIKCPGAIDHETAMQGNVPEKYIPQLQHQIEVCELDYVYYFSYTDKEYSENKLLKIYRDDKYIDSLLREERIFWECLENLEAPKLTDRDYIERKDDIWKELARRWKELQIKMSPLAEQEKTLRQQLINCAGKSSSRGENIRLSKVLQKGRVDYTSIPQLKEVNLDKYRKEPIETWRITIYDDPT